MTTKVLILGCNGFIGRHLVKFLKSQDFHVYGIGRGHYELNLLSSENFLEAEINEETISKCCPAPDVIINCAGGSSVPDSFSEPYNDFQKTSASLFAGLEFIRKNKLDCLYILTSSGAVYGNQQGILSENSLTESQVSPYGLYKKICEQICSMYHLQFGLDISVLRLFSVYGSGLSKQLLWDACNKINRGDHSFFGSGDEMRDWVHIDDVCQLYLSVIERKKAGFFLVNGGTGVGTRVKGILRLVYQGIMNEEAPKFTQAQRKGDPDMFIADISVARSIGWDAHIFPEQGVPEYTKWFKETFEP